MFSFISLSKDGPNLATNIKIKKNVIFSYIFNKIIRI